MSSKITIITDISYQSYRQRANVPLWRRESLRKKWKLSQTFSAAPLPLSIFFNTSQAQAELGSCGFKGSHTSLLCLLLDMEESICMTSDSKPLSDSRGVVLNYLQSNTATRCTGCAEWPFRFSLILLFGKVKRGWFTLVSSSLYAALKIWVSISFLVFNFHFQALHNILSF